MEENHTTGYENIINPDQSTDNLKILADAYVGPSGGSEVGVAGYRTYEVQANAPGEGILIDIVYTQPWEWNGSFDNPTYQVTVNIPNIIALSQP